MRPLSVVLSLTILSTSAFAAPQGLLSSPTSWKLTHAAAEKSPFVWNDDGLSFQSMGIAKLERDITPNAGPIEVVADIELSRGSTDRWRNNGIVLVWSSAPVDAMGQGDWAIAFMVIQQGVVATVLRDGAGWGIPRPNDTRGLFVHQGQDIAKRFILSLSGAGGERYSTEWPASSLADVRLRFHASRDADHLMRLTLYHGDGPEGPWWKGEAVLPEDLRDRPLRYAAVYVSQEAAKFGKTDSSEAEVAGKQGTGEGNGVFAGLIRRMDLGTPPEGRSWNEPLPPKPLSAQNRPAERVSHWLPAGGLAELRAKFNDPAFAHYRTLLLRNADPNVETSKQKRVESHLTANTWAYLLSEEDIYLQRTLAAIDEACRVTDKLPSLSYQGPGKLMQDLDTREFELQRYEALAQTYDLLYAQLDPVRRDAIHRALLRALRNYQERIADGSWWYLNNPSNTIGVGNGTAGLIALTLRHEHPELAAEVLDIAVPTILRQYIGVADDGGCNEGSMYWNYGMSYPLLLGYALRNATGNDRTLLLNDRLRHAHRYMETTLGGDGQLIPFNDTQPWITGWLLAAAAGSVHDQPLMRWMADHMAERFVSEPVWEEQVRASFAVAAFLFRDRKPAPDTFPGVPVLSHLASIEEAVLRSSGDTLHPALVTAVKGNGRRNTHHANQDQGSFVFYANGQMLLLDPGYFEGTPDKHSLPVIGDREKPVLDAKAHAPISHLVNEGPLRSVTVDTTAAYSSERKAQSPLASRARRIFVHVGEDALVILNDILPTDPNATVHNLFQAAVPVEQTDTGFRLENGDHDFLLLSYGPEAKRSLEKRSFSKTWVYHQRDTPWHTLIDAYTPSEQSPRVTILLRESTRATPAVDYQENAIRVRVTPDLPEIRFVRDASGWKLEPPSP